VFVLYCVSLFCIVFLCFVSCLFVLYRVCLYVLYCVCLFCIVFVCLLVISLYWGADKSLARPGKKQDTATEDFDFHISYLLS
jgi:hypothetical protein